MFLSNNVYNNIEPFRMQHVWPSNCSSLVNEHTFTQYTENAKSINLLTRKLRKSSSMHSLSLLGVYGGTPAGVGN